MQVGIESVNDRNDITFKCFESKIIGRVTTPFNKQSTIPKWNEWKDAPIELNGIKFKKRWKKNDSLLEWKKPWFKNQEWYLCYFTPSKEKDTSKKK